MTTTPSNDVSPSTDAPAKPLIDLEAGDDPAASSAEPCSDVPLAARIEALLINTDRPLSDQRLADLLGLAGAGRSRRLAEAIDALNAAYDGEERAFRIERLAGGWQILTRQQFGPLLLRLHQDRQQSRLSQAALETLAIVAYRQPIIRAEVEAIRGVACGEMLRGLLERRLVKIVGRAEELGRPMLYGTTREFLKVFGLASVDDLPEVEGLKPGAPAGGASPPSRERSASPPAEADEPDGGEAVGEDAAPPPDVEASGSA
jgi:segregation and condensation protein B